MNALKAIKAHRSSVTKKLIFKELNIPVFYRVEFEQDHHNISSWPQIAAQTGQINNLIHIKTKTHKKYLRGIIKDTLKSVFHKYEIESYNTMSSNVGRYEAVLQFFTWINEHMKNEVLYDNGTEIHGWIHQMIYTIEKFNLPFLYNWLLDEINITNLRANLAWGIQNQFVHPSDATYQPEPGGLLFDDADAFYTWTFWGLNYSERKITSESQIFLIEKNSPAVLDFFENLTTKYKPTLGSLENGRIVQNSERLYDLLKTITHANRLGDKSNLKVIYLNKTN
jgi:hypothetical protein